MRIGMLLMGGKYPPDIRVEKEARALVAGGHEVFLLTGSEEGRPPREQLGPLTVVRYPRRAPWLASKLSAVVNLATWRVPLWEREIAAYVRDNRLDALHSHDLPAVKTALAVGRALGVPVVFDMHENYPAALGFWKRSRGSRILQSPSRYRAYERWAVRSADAVIAVVDESAARVIALGAPAERVLVFGNVDDPDPTLVWRGPAAPFTVTYAGAFMPHRGLETLIDAFALVLRRMPDARLVLMGAGSSEAGIREAVVASGIAGSVEFTGWVGLDEMRRRLAESSVGVVPHLRSEHTDSTIPHKLFQYMGMGLPVVVTDCAPLERIVKETGAGSVARSGDAADLAEKLLLMADPDTALRASAAGVRAVRERYNLEVEGETLRNLYARFEAARTRR